MRACLPPYGKPLYNKEAGGHLPAIFQGVEALTHEQETPPALYNKAGSAFLLFLVCIQISTFERYESAKRLIPETISIFCRKRQDKDTVILLFLFTINSHNILMNISESKCIDCFL